MTAKIEPWMLDAGRQVNEWTQKMPTGWKPTALEIAAIIGAHAPKETGIKPDTAQAARHEPTMTGSAQVRCPSCNEWVKLIWQN